MKWRRAHAPAAWSSIVFTSLFFYILPLLFPLFGPGLRTDQDLLKTTNPAPIQRTYLAKMVDIEDRDKDIDRWLQMDSVKEGVDAKTRKTENG